MEILSPAGSGDALTAAVRTGANAVYLGGSRFSARAGAENFGREELAKAVRYCHARDVRVHLAVNTVLLENELAEAVDFVRFACTLPVDAVLIQDMGLFRILRKSAPELKLHASTQTSVHTAAGARLLYKSGFCRLVLARELSLKEISDINASCPIELEAFVHGALCMSVSGQCYFSSVLGSRSGNRGRCAQPCRLPFSAQGGTGHDLSLKDMSMVTRISELASAGVTSAKIEGRLKRPEYVAAAVTASRLSLGGKTVPENLLKDLRAVFSRSGFTSGYPDGNRGRDMFGVRSKEDVVENTGSVLAELRELYAHENPKIPVDFTIKIKYNKPVILKAADSEGRFVSVSGAFPEKALSRPVDRAICEKQLSKTGGTPFYAGSIECEADGGLSVPASELNALRREALDKLTKLREQRPAAAFSAPDYNAENRRRTGKMKLRARFTRFNMPDIPKSAKKCEYVFVPYDTPPLVLEKLTAEGFSTAIELPRGMFGMENDVRRHIADAKSAGVNHVWAGTIDGAAIGLDMGMEVHGGFSLNITNTQSLKWYEELGLADTELSFELSFPQAGHIGGQMARGLLLYGRLPLMLCRCCPAANSKRGCPNCKKPPVLTDRKGVKFPVLCYGACSEVLNSVPLYTADIINEITGQDFGTVRFTDESKEEAESILGAYFSALDGKNVEKPGVGFTRGLYHRKLI
jgi:putative protease